MAFGVLGCAGQSHTEPALQPTATLAVPAFVTLPIHQSASQLILAERRAATTRDLAMLETLWAKDGRIIDGRGTATTEDDYRWVGRLAILDRYVIAVFPNPPPLIENLDDLKITMVSNENGEEHRGRAIVTTGQDRWILVNSNGRWWLAELMYSSGN